MLYSKNHKKFTYFNGAGSFRKSWLKSSLAVELKAIYIFDSDLVWRMQLMIIKG